MEGEGCVYKVFVLFVLNDFCVVVLVFDMYWDIVWVYVIYLEFNFVFIFNLRVDKYDSLLSLFFYVKKKLRINV